MISKSLSGDGYSELKSYFLDKLAVDGMVVVPLEKARWGDTFGMLTDKFGITLRVNISDSPLL